MVPAGDVDRIQEIDRRIAHLAGGQFGVVSRRQALTLGATTGTIDRRIRTGRWVRMSATVYRLAGSPRSWRQSLLAEALTWSPDAVVSHRSAAALWRLPGFEEGPIDLIVPRNRRRAGVQGTVVHRSGRLERVDRTRIGPIPVTTASRTLIDIAGIVPIEAVEEALDNALQRGLVTISNMVRRLEALSRQGRPGIVAIRTLLDARPAGAILPDSVLETRVGRELVRRGLLGSVRQYAVTDAGRRIAVVDFAFVEARVAIEADGYRWHAGRSRWRRDLARRNALTAAGWRIVHVTWDDLSKGGWVEEVRRLLVGSIAR